ncbi:TPA: hypothetical protein KQB57_001438 [Clostridioides difficile]|uniref:hypothetical protein n=1 Tax=Clostridioides difficile TaxID=1496 RepID=UPI00016C5C68|nr:hypothetical protein [Clostridioides difficile]AXU86064.1 hypothetical protein CDIF29745_01226 [Clostridioides difficile]EGT3681624.1 hypothetical protein [Clostridioides difficile]EGT3810123.1 hypothetical protein [Clostridioides difficile]EGT3865678.1 hypothetical protein [Clostridioides difficile]EGT4629572.1 hypothetical protein [Clostridioides difficile]
METARLIAIGQIKQAEKEISRLQGTKNNSSLMWWEAVKFASQNILEGLEHDIELEASTEFREFMIIQEELERDRPIDVQL